MMGIFSIVERLGTLVEGSMRRGVLLLAAGAVFTGCAIREPMEMKTKFDYAQHEPYMQPGNNGIKGQGFMRQLGGGVVTCAGTQWKDSSANYRT
jgi:hypothetical protein